jgi:hypothetical protein
MTTPNPVLLERIRRLDGCEGTWILDRRDSNQRGYDVDRLPCFGIRTPEAALLECQQQHWRACRLLFSPAKLNADCSWPGGYDAPSAYRSNNRVFKEDFSAELELADGDADGLALDIRHVTAEMLESIEVLEHYPVLDDGDWSELELADQQEAWDCWAKSEWRDAIRDALAAYCPAAELERNQYGPHTATYWADDQLDAIPDDQLERAMLELFEACRESANEYWEEESGGGWYVRIDRIAEQLERSDLVDLTGLPLLDPSQEWRRESYPWIGADPSPLIAAL